MKLFLMDKDSGVRICNSVYSILLGFTLHSIFIANKDWNNYFVQFRLLSVLLILYYLIDWLSYKVLAELDELHNGLEVLLTIIFIIYLGWLCVFSNNISNDNYGLFFWAFIIYLVATAVLTFMYVWQCVENSTVQVKDHLSLYVDSIAKVLIVIAAFVFQEAKSRIFSDPATTYFWWIILTLLLVIKIWRFASLSHLYQTSLATNGEISTQTEATSTDS